MIERVTAESWMADPSVLRVVETIHGGDRYGDDRYGDEPDGDDAPGTGNRAGRARVAATTGADSSSP